MMDCREHFRSKNYSDTLLNQAFDDDAGSWWWWTNVIGALCFGLIGLIGNLICFLVVCRFSLPQHSFVQYLRALAIFDFLSLIFECHQSLNKLTVYFFQINLRNFRSSILCQIYEYFNHVIILLACWTIVGLTFDRLILVCDPWAKKWPNLSRRICNSQCAKKIILLFIIFSLLINIPHSITQQWTCRESGHQHSALFKEKLHSNQTQMKSLSNKLICQCRISPHLRPLTIFFVVNWKIYVFHVVCYTLIPAIILITSNAAILKVLHTPRQVVGQQNEHLRSKLTGTLTLVSSMFLILYFPHAIVEILFFNLISKYRLVCDIRSLIIIRIFKRLSELLNIAALGINFFLYILGVNHYRSAAIQMLGLHHFQIFQPYLTVEHRNSLGSMAYFTNQQTRRNTQTDPSTVRLLSINNNGINHENTILSTHRQSTSK